MIETTPIPFNRKALISFIAAMIALFALCIGFLPIPLTALFCYPPGIILGIVALILGIQARREIRQSNENGKSLALIAVWAGIITIIATLGIITVSILLYPYIAELIKQILQSINS